MLAVPDTNLVKLDGGSFPPSWLTILIAVIEHKALIGWRWHAKRRGHDSIHLLHQAFLLGTDHLQDGLFGHVRSLERNIQLSKDNPLFTKLGLEQLVQNPGRGRGV